MASRTIRATEYFSSYTALGGSDYIIYTSDYDFDASVSNKSVSGGSISVSNYYLDTSEEFYFEIYMQDTLVCRSVSGSFSTGGPYTIELAIDTDTVNSNILLTSGPTSITVKAYRVTNDDIYIGEVYQSSTVTLIIEYTNPPELQWVNKSINVSQEGMKVRVSWTAVKSINGAGTPFYIVFSDDYVELYEGTSTDVLLTPLQYDTACSYYVMAYSARVAEGGYSNTVSFTASSAGVYFYHHTIRCYLNNEWKDCLVYYYDGIDWIECVPYYYDGVSWKTCSF